MNPAPYTNTFLGLIVGMSLSIAPRTLAAAHTLSNHALSLQFSRQDALFEVKDIRSGLTYRQRRFRFPATKALEVTKERDALLVRREQAGIQFEAVFRFDKLEPALSVGLRAAAQTRLKQLVYPYPFVWPDEKGNLAWPLREGLVIPATLLRPRLCGRKSLVLVPE